MERFDNNNLKEIRIRLNAALNSIGEELGLHLDIGNIRYEAHSFRTTLSASIKNRTMNVVERSLSNNPLAALGDGQYIGRRFMNQGVIYTIKNLNYRQYKYPVIAVDQFGHQFKFRNDVLNRLLEE